MSEEQVSAELPRSRPIAEPSKRIFRGTSDPACVVAASGSGGTGDPIKLDALDS